MYWKYSNVILIILRSEYFKTALNTEVGGGWKRVITVEECSHLVLSAVIDFMYGINIPDDFIMEDMYSLLAMADLYLMECLKDAIAPLLSKQLKTDNILETSRMAEKHSALKLKEFCCDFILSNIDALDISLLDNLFAVMPFVGRVCLQKQKMQHRGVEIANKILGIDLAELDDFKRRSDFSSNLDYRQYVRANIKHNMLLRCIVIAHWDGVPDDEFASPIPTRVPDGTLGRVVTLNRHTSMATVKWQGKRKCVGSMCWVELLTLPIACDIFA